MSSIINQLRSRLVDYNTIMSNCIFSIKDTGFMDISIIVPVHGRTEFTKPLCDYFQRAIAQEKLRLSFGKKTISLTIVEHSDTPEHDKICPPWVNYIWIPKNNLPFNKCLCMNIGAIKMQNCLSYLFHDIDTIVPQNYFVDLWKNINNRNLDCCQTFTKRRLLHCNESLTNFILLDTAIVESFNAENKDVEMAKIGAAGGSIWISKFGFLVVGGWNDAFFSEYSLEDQFFFDKMGLFLKLGFCDDPAIELLHLHHPPAYGRVTKPQDLEAYAAFRRLDIYLQKELVAVERDHIMKFIPPGKNIIIEIQKLLQQELRPIPTDYPNNTSDCPIKINIPVVATVKESVSTEIMSFFDKHFFLSAKSNGQYFDFDKSNNHIKEELDKIIKKRLGI